MRSVRSAPADGVGRHEVAHPARALGVIACGAREVDQLLARFDGLGDGLRIALDEPAERRRRGDALARRLVELGRAPQRLALDLDRARRRRRCARTRWPHARCCRLRRTRRRASSSRRRRARDSGRRCGSSRARSSHAASRPSGSARRPRRTPPSRARATTERPARRARSGRRRRRAAPPSALARPACRSTTRCAP